MKVILLISLLLLSLPADSLGTLSIGGYASAVIGLSGSPVTSLSNGQTGSSIVETGDGNNEVTAAVNFGDLSSGNGSPEVASIGLRSRGNTPCHISAGVTSYSASNLTYSGNKLQGSLGNELTFITLGNGNVSAGSSGNDSGHSYGKLFQGGSTLNQLNGGTIGQVNKDSDRFAVFSSPPSLAGNLQSSSNYVQDICTLSVPTGLVWGTAGEGSGSFNVVLQFEIFPGV